MLTVINPQERRKRSRRGAAMIIALMLIVVITMLMAATFLVTEVQLSSSKSERDYERALMMAEAGMNAYINMLTNGPGTGTNAAYIPPVYIFSASGLGAAPTLAQFKTGVKSGTYSLTKYPAGSQQGYFVGQAPGAGPTQYYITSYGWSNGICREVSVENTEVGTYALWANSIVDLKGNSSITGNVGTDGDVSMKGSSSIIGNLTLWDGGKLTGSGVTGATLSEAADLVWPTVESIATTDFPGPPAGLLWLATNNDNGLVPGIPASGILPSGNITFIGKPGGANYYLTSIGAAGNTTIKFDNTLGPITLWLGPSGGNGTVTFTGNSTVIPTTTDPTKPVLIYSALDTSITMTGTSSDYVGIYNLNAGGTASVTMKGTSAINTAVITNTYSAVGNSAVIKYTRGLFAAPGSTLTSSAWTELY